MLTIGNTEYRNLQEQVRKNKNDIKYLLEEGGTLNQFGIRVIGIVENQTQLPNPSTYTGEYGDAYAVGTQPPYELYIWTRPISGQAGDFWFNIGQFPAPSYVPGPKGDTGDTGPVGPRGSLWYSQTGVPTNTVGVNPNDQALNGTNGDVYQFVNGQWQLTGNIMGPRGLTGATGPMGPASTVPGPKGDTGPRGADGESIEIIGTLSNVDQLPDPTTVKRNYAYLVTINNEEHIYLIIGEGTTENPLLWHDAGAFGGGTTIIVDNNKQSEVDLSNVYNGAYGIYTDDRIKTALSDVKTRFLQIGTTGRNINGTSKYQRAYIELPIVDSDNIQRKSNGSTLSFDLSDTYKAELDSKINNVKPLEIVISTPTTATNGSLSADQLTTLQNNKSAVIVLNKEVYRLQDNQHESGYLIYSHIGYENNTQSYIIKCLTITISTRGWVLTSREVEDVYKDYYNLGAYDTIITNNDGTVTITRQTGYFTIDGSENWINWNAQGGVGSARFVTRDLPAVFSKTGSTGIITAKSNGFDLVTEGTAYVHTLPKAIGLQKLDAGNIINVTASITEITNAATAKEYFGNNPCYIQYKLAPQYVYTEVLQEVQPMNPANQEQEFYWNNEWKKGINLFDDTILRNTTLEEAKGFNIPFTIEPGTYTSLTSVGDGILQTQGVVALYLIDKNGSLIQTISSIAPNAVTNLPWTFNVNADIASKTTQVRFYYNGSALVGSILNGVMITKGTNKYPYQPYRGNLIREKQLETELNTLKDDVANNYLAKSEKNNFVKTIAQINSGDLNTFGTTGLYGVTADVLNRPTEQDGYLIVIRWGGETSYWVMQMYIAAVDSGVIYTRRNDSGTAYDTWTNWARQGAEYSLSGTTLTITN